MKQRLYNFWLSSKEFIKDRDNKRSFALFALTCCLCTAYTVLRNLKDTLALTASQSGAEILPFLKVWGMLPAAFLGTWGYTKLSNKFSQKQVFYIFILGFIAYYWTFLLFIFPNIETLNLTKTSAWLLNVLPPGFRGLVSFFCNWTISSFYVITELWGIIVLNVIFWAFVNQNTSVSRAKKSYGLLNIGSNLAPIFGGGLALMCSTAESSLTLNSWQQTLTQLTLLVTALGGGAVAIFYYINKYMLPTHQDQQKQEKEKVKISLLNCFKHISKSQYLLSLSMLVVGYNICINFTDVLWKAQLKSYFDTPNDILSHMSKVTIFIGIAATFAGVSFASVIRRFGWKTVALATPSIIFLTGIAFFSLLLLQKPLTPLIYSTLGVTPLALLVYIGAMQHTLTKAFKYSLFDSSKEVAFVILDKNSQLQGKAAIDGLGSSIGKSGSSITYQFLLVATGSIGSSAPYVAVLLFLVLFCWFLAITTVGREFKIKSSQLEVNTPEAT